MAVPHHITHLFETGFMVAMLFTPRVLQNMILIHRSDHSLKSVTVIACPLVFARPINQINQSDQQLYKRDMTEPLNVGNV